MSKQEPICVNTEQKTNEFTDPNNLIKELHKAAGYYYFTNKTSVKVKALWDKLPTAVKKEFFNKQEGTWIVLEFAADFNDVEFMEECWGYTQNKAQKAALLKGYFYGAYRRAAQHDSQQSLQKLWEYALEVEAQQELLEMSLTEAVQKAAANGHVLIILDIWSHVCSLGNEGLKYKINMLKRGNIYADGTVTEYKALWDAIDKGHLNTAAALLYLCEATIEGFDAQEAFHNISTLDRYSIQESSFINVLTYFGDFKNLLNLIAASNQSNNVLGSTNEVAELVDNNASYDEELAGNISIFHSES